MDYKAYRKKLGLTQEQMGKLTDTSRRTWQNWELGIRKPAPAMEKMLKEKLDRMLEKPR